MPIEDGCGGVMKQSFKDMGRPCRGPTVLPTEARCSSSCLARARAGVNMTSVKQFVCRDLSDNLCNLYCVVS